MLLISNYLLQSSPPRECSPPHQELPCLVQALLHPLPLLKGLPAPLCHVQQVGQALLLATLKVQQGVEEILPERTLPASSWFEISWLPSSCALRLFHLEIFSDEKAINSGGNAKVVNVMTPRTTLAHLDAPKPRGRDLVGEDSVLGNQLHV